MSLRPRGGRKQSKLNSGERHEGCPRGDTFDGWLQPIARIGNLGDEEWPLASKDQTGPLGLIDNPQCPGAPKRYEKSAEYCEFHGYAQYGECKRRPLCIGLFDPLPDNETKGVIRAWDKRH